MTHQLRFFPAPYWVQWSLLALLFLFAVHMLPAHAGEQWQSRIDDEVKLVLGKFEQEKSVYIREPFDSTKEMQRFPFIYDEVRNALKHSVRGHGHAVVNRIDADATLKTEFTARKNRLTLILTLRDKRDSKKSTIGRSFTILSNELPEDWKERSLKDVATQLVRKLDAAFAGSQLQIVLGEISGGKTKSDSLVSPFTIVMRGYIQEELGKFRNTFQVLSVETESADTRRLDGHFQDLETTVVLQLRLHSEEFPERVVTAQFPIQTIPSGLALYPDNLNIAEGMNDGPVVEGDTGSTMPKNRLAAWVNREDRTYRDGQDLILFVRPHVDLYARVFYIWSDGSICQIFPFRSDDLGFLAKNRTRRIPEEGSGVRYVITDETTGQETIKVFTSFGPIDDSGLPLEYLGQTKHRCVTSDYKDLKTALTRGLKLKHEVRPEAEVKILVVK